MLALQHQQSETTRSLCEIIENGQGIAVSPAIHPLVMQLLSEPEQLHTLVHCFGSPLNIVFPSLVENTIRDFQGVFKQEGVLGDVIYTTKPNRSRGIVKHVALCKVPVDVSSSGALAGALNAGIPGSRIHASGPKNIDYIALTLQQGATVCIDSFAELELLDTLIQNACSDSAPKVMVRLSSFRESSSGSLGTGSIFGIPVADIAELLEKLQSMKRRIRFEGFSFHLPIPTDQERLVALEGSLDAFLAAQRRGLSPRVVNIGGGFRIRYAASQTEWQQFQAYLKASVLGHAKPTTWNGTGLGYQITDKGLAGSPAFQDHFVALSGPEQFRSFLRQRVPRFDGGTVGQVLRDMLIHVEVEPGRAILDQAGITVARVASRKENGRGDILLSLEMNHSNIRSDEQKLLTQPVFIPQGPRELDPRGIFLVGNLCIPNDLIQYQQVFPAFRAERGDLFAFMNTAAYLMDFVESPVLHQPVARKVVAMKRQSSWRFSLDDEHSAIREKLGATL